MHKITQKVPHSSACIGAGLIGPRLGPEPCRCICLGLYLSKHSLDQEPPIPDQTFTCNGD